MLPITSAAPVLAEPGVAVGPERRGQRGGRNTISARRRVDIAQIGGGGG